MTNQIIISNISIHQDAEGRYSLNDLHAASGKSDKDKPANWLRAEKTIELIEEILNAQIRAFKNDDVLKVGIPTFNPVDSKKGRYGGTYVCKELVYSYAMWISAAFALKVIRAYDALVTGKIGGGNDKTTTDDRTPLRGLVNRIMGKYGLTYQAVYKLVHKEFGVDCIDQLSQRQASEAMEYLAAKVLEGEFIAKGSAPLIAPPRSSSRVMMYLDKNGAVVGTMPLQDDQVVMSFKSFAEFAKKKGMILMHKKELSEKLASILA